MSDRRPDAPDAEPLPEPLASRVLARASELDASRKAHSTVAELREAAAEAGISVPAFDAALAELRAGEQQPVVPAIIQPRWKKRLKSLAVVAALLIAVGAYGLARRSTAETAVGSVAATPQMIEETFLLRCVSPGEASELIRPLLRLSTNSVVYSPTRSPRALTVRATPAQIESVRSLLAQHEGDGSSACALGDVPAPNP